MMNSTRLPLLIAALTACNFPRPANVGDDQPLDASTSGDGSTSIDASTSVDASIDAPEQPGTVLHVSPSGDDANDGLTKPVKTLKRAVGLAAANQEIRTIVLATGRYSTAGGETFPYAVPANVTIVGPTGGGAILVGTTTEIGMVLDTGALKDLELEDFSVAIAATGMASLTNIRVRTSTTAVRAETAASLTVDNLDIAGEVGACATGIELNGGAALSAARLATRNLGRSLVARDRSTATVTMANVAGLVSCTMIVISVTSTSMFSLSDSLLDGGFVGVTIDSPMISAPTRATLLNTTIRNMDSHGLGIGNAVGEMRGGELSSTRSTNFTTIGGDWKLSDVSIANANVGAFVQEARLVIRNCTISGNGVGIALSLSARGDFGTASDLGNNVITTTQMGLLVEGGVNGPTQAVGNTWKPVQGASGQGKYSVGTLIVGPIEGVSGNNFNVASGQSIQL
jgi:hypothetical protein